MAHTAGDTSARATRRRTARDGDALPRRLDASMTLLTEVMQRPLDPAYALAARKRRAAPPMSVSARSRAAAITVVIAIVCGWVTTWSVAELRRPEPGAMGARDRLEAEIARRTRLADALQRKNETLRAQIAVEQDQTLQTVEGKALADRAQALGLVSGEMAVTGPGLEITLDDAAASSDQAGSVDPRDNPDADQGRVLDRDLQIIVNGLWVAGAEALSINGQRLTALSAIRSAGEAILVDFRPLVRPYVIQAVGDVSRMQARFSLDAAGPYLQSLHDNYGVRAGIAVKDQLRLPGAGQLVLRLAQPPEQTPQPSVTGTGTSPAASAAASNPSPS